MWLFFNQCSCASLPSCWIDPFKVFVLFIPARDNWLLKLVKTCPPHLVCSKRSVKATWFQLKLILHLWNRSKTGCLRGQSRRVAWQSRDWREKQPSEFCLFQYEAEWNGKKRSAASDFKYRKPLLAFCTSLSQLFYSQIEQRAAHRLELEWTQNKSWRIN